MPCVYQQLGAGSHAHLLVDAGKRRAPNFRVVEYDHARGCCTVYLPEGNVLVPLDSAAKRSNTPVYKSVLVRIEPLGRKA